MASWIVHLRVADKIINNLEGVSTTDFVIGNIGPDCGEPNENWTQYNPPKKITHWMNESKRICPELFYDQYIREEDKAKDFSKYSFYLGYYVHLLTDVAWKKEISLPTEKLYAHEFSMEDRDTVYARIKEDWYDLDFLFLKNNPGFRAYEVFKESKDYNNDYLPYYSNRAIPKQIRYIREFYDGPHGQLQREYKYLSSGKMDKFVEQCSIGIMKVLKDKKII